MIKRGQSNILINGDDQNDPLARASLKQDSAMLIDDGLSSAHSIGREIDAVLARKEEKRKSRKARR